MRQTIYFLALLTLYSCTDNQVKNKRTSTPSSSNYTNEVRSGENYNEVNSHYNDNYHADPDYKYEYRTGDPGDYEYNYDIYGSDENGNSAYGNIDISGKYGSGYIEDEDGNEKYIDVEWVDYGILEGVDEDGNTYEFEVYE